MGIKIIKPCFCGGTEISVKKRAYNEGMDGYSNDWVFHCNKCSCEINYPADGFYGRDYYKTIEDAIVKWNKDHEKVFPPIGQDIDKSLANLKTLQADYQQFHDDVWQNPESYGIIAESLKVAISTMRKYQKIGEIYNNWNVDFGVETHRAMSKIGEVLNDGNDD